MNFFLGSLPYLNPAKAIEFVNKYSKELPFLPQLPETGQSEDMVGQVLRGIKEGKWDKDASACFEPFFTEYKDAGHAKIQVAGPLTVARTLSTTYDDIWKSWFQFVKQLSFQIDEMGFSGQLWIQIDEPVWSRDVPLPDEYGTLVCSLRGMRKGNIIGVHSCATNRPVLTKTFAGFCNFLCFDFTKNPMTSDEKTFWEDLWKSANTKLIAGITPKGEKANEKQIEPFSEGESICYSAGCGLYDWSENEIQQSYGS